MESIYEIAEGRWEDILMSLGGLSSKQLTNEHQPCPCCGGKDRYRFDNTKNQGTWFCNKCGGKSGTGGGGNGLSLLMRLRNWDFKQAVSEVEKYLGVAKPIPKPPLKGAENFWFYSDKFIVARFPNKKIRPLSFNGTKWEYKAPPSPRPLLNLNKLLEDKKKTIVIVEGEKTCDAAQKLFPMLIATTWASGCKAINKTDWTPLKGRKIVLFPDNDQVGFDAMDRLAQLLFNIGVETIKQVNPPDDAKQGWDLADATWTTKEAIQFVKQRYFYVTKKDDVEELIPQVETETEVDKYFQCLGFDGETYFYQPRATGQVTKLSRAGHTSTNLVSIAPLSYWETLYPAKSGANWTQAASNLFEASANVGVYSPNKIRGRGAYIDKKHTLLHLGEEIICNGERLSILKKLPFKTNYIYQRSANLNGCGNESPLSNEAAFEILELAQRFQWDVQASGMLLAGWVALAPVCGALDWRPHIWLTGGAGTGKSAILDRFVSPLLGDMGVHVSGNTTEAGLRQTLKSDALPIIFDEAESNEKADQQRMQSILALARVASSETNAQMIKGSPNGEVIRFHLRSMFFLSSISTALKQGADRTRFAQLTLKSTSKFNKHERAYHWEQLEKDLDNKINEQTAKKLIARTFSLINVIKKNIKVFSRLAGEKFDSQRLGDQYGALLAGAYSLMSNELVNLQTAEQMINSVSWDSYSESTELPDERRCLQTILQHSVKIDKTDILLGELVEIAGGKYHTFVESEQAQDTLGRNGLKVNNDFLMVSNTSEALREILNGTSWQHSWSQVLTRLPNAEKAPATRFKGQGSVAKAVKIPVIALDIEEVA